jgi:glycosyltransferase involved in cell wall biosynthesis
MSQIKILCLFDYNCHTGFATVSRNLVKHWKNHFGDNLQLDICAVNYFGDDYNDGKNVRVISAKKKDVAKDDFGRYVFMRSLKDGDYDLIFILQDLGVVVPTIKFLREIRKERKVLGKKDFKSILYFPVDFALTPNLGVDIEFFDYLATYTEYGRAQVLRLKPNISKKLHVIPHGNDMDDFNYIDRQEIQEFRNQFFGKNANKFIVTNVNRNQSRKDIPNTIFGFLEYWEEYNQNAFLYLHMDPKDPMGWNLRTILAQTPLREGEHFQLTEEKYLQKGAPIEHIKKIYNASDVFLSTATGGGWELSVTEAMACKVPVIIPNHTSLGEIGKGGERAYMLNTLYPTVAMVDNVIRFQADLYEIAETLNQVYKDKKSNALDQKIKIDNAYNFVSSLSWEPIAKTFIRAIRELTK